VHSAWFDIGLMLTSITHVCILYVYMYIYQWGSMPRWQFSAARYFCRKDVFINFINLPTFWILKMWKCRCDKVQKVLNEIFRRFVACCRVGRE